MIENKKFLKLNNAEKQRVYQSQKLSKQFKNFVSPHPKIQTGPF